MGYLKTVKLYEARVYKHITTSKQLHGIYIENTYIHTYIHGIGTTKACWSYGNTQIKVKQQYI